MKRLDSPDARCSVFVDAGPNHASVRCEIAQDWGLTDEQIAQCWDSLAKITECPISQLQNAELCGPTAKQDGDRSIRVGLLSPDLADAVGAAWLEIGSAALKCWVAGEPVPVRFAEGYGI